MGGNFHTAPSDMIRTQCERLLENSERLAARDPEVIGDLANVLTLSGFSMGLADESSPASGSEHVMSHLIDMSSGVRKTGICYHGTQVAVSGILSCILWDYLLHEFDPAKVDVDACYPSLEEMEPRVKAAFDWLDDTHSAANECWSDYQKKLSRWHANKENLKAFLGSFDAFKAQVAGWVKDPRYREKNVLDQVMRSCKDRRIAILQLQVTSLAEGDAAYEAVIQLRPRREIRHELLLAHIREMPGILSVREGSTTEENV